MKQCNKKRMVKLIVMLLTIFGAISSYLHVNANEDTITTEEIQDTNAEYDMLETSESNSPMTNILVNTRASGLTSLGPSLPGGLSFTISNHVTTFKPLYVNGILVYCLKPNTRFNSNATVEIVESQLAPSLQRKVITAMAFGYPFETDSSNESRAKHAITQVIIWALIEGYTTSEQFDTYSQEVVSSLESNLWAGSNNYYQELKRMTLTAEVKPSFDANTITLKWNPINSRYEATITDTNGVLDRYNYQASGINFERTGNSLLIHTTNKYETNIQASALFTINGGMMVWENPNLSNFQPTAQYYADKGGYEIPTILNIKTIEPEIGTTAIAEETEDHIANAKEQVTIIDTVQYTNLDIGEEYQISGKLMVKETSLPLLVNGQEVIAEKKFTPTSVDGTIDLEFTFDASALKGQTVVVFEHLYTQGIEVATHTDINDAKQSVNFPEIGTTAFDKADGDQVISTDEVVTIVDTIAYKNLLVGKTYTVKGILMDKSTNQPLLINGQPILGETTFTANTADGTVDVEYTFDARLLFNTTIVVFEKLYFNGIEIATHEDINDINQTITTPEEPEINTTALDKETQEHIANPKGTVTIIDTVEYKKLEVGKEYTVKGILMNKATNQPLLVNGQEITAEKTFIAETSDGNIDLEFIFDASALEGTTVVIFERLEKDGLEVATHTDINDKNQSIHFPKIRTKAVDKADGDQKISAKDKVTIVDTVSYTNLLVGKEYKIEGKLIDKATGLPLLVNGKEVTATTTFVPEKESGTVSLEFTFDATALYGKKVVVFEKVYLGDKLVGAHEDINDTNQTIDIENQVEKRGAIWTGDISSTEGYIVLLALASMIIVWLQRKHVLWHR